MLSLDELITLQIALVEHHRRLIETESNESALIEQVETLILQLQEAIDASELLSRSKRIQKRERERDE